MLKTPKCGETRRSQVVIPSINRAAQMSSFVPKRQFPISSISCAQCKPQGVRAFVSTDLMLHWGPRKSWWLWGGDSVKFWRPWKPWKEIILKYWWLLIFDREIAWWNDYTNNENWESPLAIHFFCAAHFQDPPTHNVSHQSYQWCYMMIQGAFFFTVPPKKRLSIKKS